MSGVSGSRRRSEISATLDALAFKAYLVAVFLVPFRWLSPLASVYGNGEWSDVLVGLVALLWAASFCLNPSATRHHLVYRRWELPLGGFLVLSAASAAAAHAGDIKGVLLSIELALLGVFTAHYCSMPERRRLVMRTIVASAALTVLLGAIGLLLFYAGAHTSLIGVYGEQYIPSKLYARLRVGTESPPLLASYCIFASGVVASASVRLPRKPQIWLQTGLGILCALTFSRGLLGFLLALVLRNVARMPKRKRLAVAVSASALAVTLIAGLTVGRLHLDPIKPASFSYSVPDPGNRREAFVTALRTFEHHPWLGIGPGALPALNRGQPFRAHFTPLNVAATLGFPALVALIAMLWLVWWGRRRPVDAAMWAAAAGVVLDGLAQDIDHFRHVWVLIGFLGA